MRKSLTSRVGADLAQHRTAILLHHALDAALEPWPNASSTVKEDQVRAPTDECFTGACWQEPAVVRQ